MLRGTDAEHLGHEASAIIGSGRAASTSASPAASEPATSTWTERLPPRAASLTGHTGLRGLFETSQPAVLFDHPASHAALGQVHSPNQRHADQADDSENRDDLHPPHARSHGASHARFTNGGPAIDSYAIGAFHPTDPNLNVFETVCGTRRSHVLT